nr:retrovirus-related Pol polyprotein from transposon TNT 1-94 [Tanacetum cinerariifolium]
MDEQLEHIPHKALRIEDSTHCGSQMIANHLKDRSVKEVLMMVLVMHTEEDDTVLHIEKTGMLMLVVEIDVGGMIADVVDKLNCSSDDVQPRQVDLRSAHALTELHWHDTHVDPDRHEVDQRKQAHASHKAKNVVSMTRCLELLHMDLFGPSVVRSYEGNRYNLVIVDDYSRKVEESLNVTFDETPPPSNTLPLVDDDLDEEEAIKRLDELAYGIPSDGPYQTNPPSIEHIISSIRIDQEGQVRRIRHEEEIDVHDYQILTREIIPTLKPLEEIIWENVFCLG